MIEFEIILKALELFVTVLSALGLLLTMLRLLLILIPPLIEDSRKLWVEIKETTRSVRAKGDADD